MFHHSPPKIPYTFNICFLTPIETIGSYFLILFLRQNSLKIVPLEARYHLIFLCSAISILY